MRHTAIISLLTVIAMLCIATFPVDARDFVVVIDPGHGGKDAGAVGKSATEKSINLNVGLKLRDMLKAGMKDVKVEMTRDTDRFIQLQGRADYANKKHADIFVSIHANSVSSKSPAHRTINGAAVYTLGLDRSETNLNVAMRENEVMKLEADYSTTYQGFDPSSAESYIAFEMMQHKNIDQSIALAEAVQNQLVKTAGRKNNGVRQAPFWVLVRTGMPAILVELDFICNPEMERFMASDAGSTKLARAIYNGIARYRSVSTGRGASENVSGETSDDSSDCNPEGPAEAPVVTDQGPTVYRIQYLTSSAPFGKGDKRLKGISPEYYIENGVTKYVTGTFNTVKETNVELKKIKTKFPDAFVIKMCDGKRVR